MPIRKTATNIPPKMASASAKIVTTGIISVAASTRGTAR
ncbi:MAG: hypothetical protein FD129_1369 [bacterium]|nr:MAG: hypothetical protein FD129_1369 [bacterium]